MRDTDMAEVGPRVVSVRASLHLYHHSRPPAGPLARSSEQNALSSQGRLTVQLDLAPLLPHVAPPSSTASGTQAELLLLMSVNHALQRVDLHEPVRPLCAKEEEEESDAAARGGRPDGAYAACNDGAPAMKSKDEDEWARRDGGAGGTDRACRFSLTRIDRASVRWVRPPTRQRPIDGRSRGTCDEQRHAPPRSPAARATERSVDGRASENVPDKGAAVQTKRAKRTMNHVEEEEKEEEEEEEDDDDAETTKRRVGDMASGGAMDADGANAAAPPDGVSQSCDSPHPVRDSADDTPIDDNDVLTLVFPSSSAPSSRRLGDRDSASSDRVDRAGTVDCADVEDTRTPPGDDGGHRRGGGEAAFGLDTHVHEARQRWDEANVPPQRGTEAGQPLAECDTSPACAIPAPSSSSSSSLFLWPHRPPSPWRTRLLSTISSSPAAGPTWRQGATDSAGGGGRAESVALAAAPPPPPPRRTLRLTSAAWHSPPPPPPRRLVVDVAADNDDPTTAPERDGKSSGAVHTPATDKVTTNTAPALHHHLHSPVWGAAAAADVNDAEAAVVYYRFVVHVPPVATMPTTATTTAMGTGAAPDEKACRRCAYRLRELVLTFATPSAPPPPYTHNTTDEMGSDAATREPAIDAKQHHGTMRVAQRGHGGDRREAHTRTADPTAESNRADAADDADGGHRRWGDGGTRPHTASACPVEILAGGGGGGYTIWRGHTGDRAALLCPMITSVVSHNDDKGGCGIVAVDPLAVTVCHWQPDDGAAMLWSRLPVRVGDLRGAVVAGGGGYTRVEVPAGGDALESETQSVVGPVCYHFFDMDYRVWLPALHGHLCSILATCANALWDADADADADATRETAAGAGAVRHVVLTRQARAGLTMQRGVDSTADAIVVSSALLAALSPPPAPRRTRPSASCAAGRAAARWRHRAATTLRSAVCLHALRRVHRRDGAVKLPALAHAFALAHGFGCVCHDAEAVLAEECRVLRAGWAVGRRGSAAAAHTAHTASVWSSWGEADSLVGHPAWVRYMTTLYDTMRILSHAALRALLLLSPERPGVLRRASALLAAGALPAETVDVDASTPCEFNASTPVDAEEWTVWGRRWGLRGGEVSITSQSSDQSLSGATSLHVTLRWRSLPTRAACGSCGGGSGTAAAVVSRRASVTVPLMAMVFGLSLSRTRQREDDAHRGGVSAGHGARADAESADMAYGRVGEEEGEKRGWRGAKADSGAMGGHSEPSWQRRKARSPRDGFLSHREGVLDHREGVFSHRDGSLNHRDQRTNAGRRHAAAERGVHSRSWRRVGVTVQLIQVTPLHWSLPARATLRGHTQRVVVNLLLAPPALLRWGGEEMRMSHRRAAAAGGVGKARQTATEEESRTKRARVRHGRVAQLPLPPQVGDRHRVEQPHVKPHCTAHTRGVRERDGQTVPVDEDVGTTRAAADSVRVAAAAAAQTRAVGMIYLPLVVVDRRAAAALLGEVRVDYRETFWQSLRRRLGADARAPAPADGSATVSSSAVDAASARVEEGDVCVAAAAALLRRVAVWSIVAELAPVPWGRGMPSDRDVWAPYAVPVQHSATMTCASHAAHTGGDRLDGAVVSCYRTLWNALLRDGLRACAEEEEEEKKKEEDGIGGGVHTQTHRRSDGRIVQDGTTNTSDVVTSNHADPDSDGDHRHGSPGIRLSVSRRWQYRAVCAATQIRWLGVAAREMLRRRPPVRDCVVDGHRRTSATCEEEEEEEDGSAAGSHDALSCVSQVQRCRDADIPALLSRTLDGASLHLLHRWGSLHAVGRDTPVHAAHDGRSSHSRGRTVMRHADGMGACDAIRCNVGGKHARAQESGIEDSDEEEEEEEVSGLRLLYEASREVRVCSADAATNRSCVMAAPTQDGKHMAHAVLELLHRRAANQGADSNNDTTQPPHPPQPKPPRVVDPQQHEASWERRAGRAVLTLSRSACTPATTAAPAAVIPSVPMATPERLSFSRHNDRGGLRPRCHRRPWAVAALSQRIDCLVQECRRALCTPSAPASAKPRHEAGKTNGTDSDRNTDDAMDETNRQDSIAVVSTAPASASVRALMMPLELCSCANAEADEEEAATKQQSSAHTLSTPTTRKRCRPVYSSHVTKSATTGG